MLSGRANLAERIIVATDREDVARAVVKRLAAKRAATRRSPVRHRTVGGSGRGSAIQRRYRYCERSGR